MFDYSSPTGTSLLSTTGALPIYRQFLESQNVTGAGDPNSQFESLETFSQMDPAKISSASVSWDAYPLSRSASAGELIDRNRNALQDEYIEWRVEKSGDSVTRITFCTQFVEYFLALAAVGLDALILGVQESEPTAAPTALELFGIADPGAIARLSPIQRVEVYREHTFTNNRNPWNNGEKGILHLSQPANTLGALYGLVIPCATPQPTVLPANICGGNFCVPSRNSDPKVCTAAQTLARGGQALTLADPVGLQIGNLIGDWEVDGAPISITGSSFWTVSLNGRRAVLDVPSGMTLDGDSIETGTQVSRLLEVLVSVNHAADSDLPTGMRMNFGVSRLT